MGGYYARAQGLPDAVADAIRDHYKPVGQGDDVPTAPVTVAVSLADKLDTLVGFFGIYEKPTGSKDPFALRRAALAAIRTILSNQCRGSLQHMFLAAREITLQREYDQHILDNWPRVLEEQANARQSVAELLATESGEVHHISAIWLQMERQDAAFQMNEAQAKDIASAYAARNMQVGLQEWSTLWPEFEAFFADRLKVQQREAGVRHDLIDAVFALGGEDDLVRLLARVKALQAFVTTQEGADLLAGYKRAANILKASGSAEKGTVPSEAPRTVPGEAVEGSASNGTVPIRGQSPAEDHLLTALNTAEPLATAAIEAEDFEGAMAALASLRAPIDAFFDGVMVNDPDPEKRAFRVGLLTRFRDAVHRVADFSRIEG